MARPVLLHPTQQTVGVEFAGRYRDPFVVMRQYDAGLVPAPFLQPVTDLPAILLARRIGGVAAYNVVDLLSFPLAAMTACLLAWGLTRSAVAAVSAGLIFAWSPFHLAQAAYHLHIAQLQWLPLLLLAAWRLARAPRAARVLELGVAGLLLAGASFYLGFIGAVVLPIALLTAVLGAPAANQPSRRRSILIVAALSLVLIAALGAALIAAPLLLPGDAAQYAFSAGDQALYAARWRSYLWPAAGAVEQQVAPGWSVLVLAAIGIGSAAGAPRARPAAIWLVAVAGFALICSTNPGARLLFAVSPFFRAHARFGAVVALAAAIAAGMGVQALWDRRRLRSVAALAIAVLALESAPAAVRARDILPTPGYRWLAARTDWRVLDCTPPGREYGASVAVLLGARAGFREGVFADCAAPGLAGTLARYRYTHLLVRSGSREGRWLSAGGRLPGLTLASASAEDRVFAVTAPAAPVFVSGATGFHDREFDGAATWRWMPRQAEWLVTNAGTLTATPLALHAAAFDGPRHLEIWIGDRLAASVAISGADWYRFPPIDLSNGETRVTLRVPEGDVVADDVLRNGDRRRLAIRVDDWRWQ